MATSDQMKARIAEMARELGPYYQLVRELAPHLRRGSKVLVQRYDHDEREDDEVVDEDHCGLRSDLSSSPG